MLRDLKFFLKNNGPTSSSAIAKAIRQDDDMVQLLLSQWIAKGKVVTMQPGCNLTCHGCAITDQLYAWQN